MSKTKRKPWVELGHGTIKIEAGDKLERSLRAERAVSEYHAVGPTISLLGFDLVFDGGRSRVRGMTCPECNARELRPHGLAAIYQEPGSTYPDRVKPFRCAACGHPIGKLDRLVGTLVPDAKDQLAIFRQVGATTPIEREWVVVETAGTRVMRESAREALDAALGNVTSDVVKIVKLVAFNEQQALGTLHASDLPLVECSLDRVGRPLERWNVRPTVAERRELDEAHRDYRRETEAVIDQELRRVKAERMAAAGF